MIRKSNSPPVYKKDLQPRVSLDVGAKHETDSLTMSDAPTELEMRRRIKYGAPLTAAWGLFSDYCNNSTIHGVKYLGERRRPWMERAWWVIVFVLSIYGCSRLIWNVWNKWDQSPVIVSFAEKSTPVWQIPFPAVTICPETKSKREFLNYTEVYHLFRSAEPEYNLTDEQIAKFEAVSQVCDAHLVADTKIGENTTDSKCAEYLREMAPTAEEILFFCKWRNTPDTCEDLFTDILTEEGFCYTFNALNSSEIYRESALHDDFVFHTHNKTSEHWTLEDGYTPEASLTPFPVRVLGAGARAGLFILLRLYEYDLDYICRGPVQGFKILLHTPGEIPQVSKQYFRVPLNQEVVVSVKPNMITTSDGLRDYSPNRRQCFFNHERYLRYFKIYTQQNCELECLSNFTRSKCGCVKFSMPRDPDTPICGAANIGCYNEAEDQLLQREIKEGLQDSKLNVKGQTQCNCLPACTSIAYDAEISQADFDWESLFIAYKNPLDEFPGVQLARLSIFFKETQFITSKRSELYGPTDFLANCGGLLGLFMGVSLLSIVEIIYFCTLRLICNLRMRKSRKLSIANNPGIVVLTPSKALPGDLKDTK
ncbi:pickpocket protein 28 [Sergentomyia squamirostris]